MLVLIGTNSREGGSYIVRGMDNKKSPERTQGLSSRNNKTTTVTYT
jgi:hypothetical protein